MDFDWNDANRNHIAEHGISPDEAEQVVKNEPIDVTLQSREGEERIGRWEKPMRNEFWL